MQISLTSFFRGAVCAGLVVTLASPSAWAAAVTWDGSTNADWLTGTNWGADVAPAPGDAVVIDDGALPNQPTLGAADAATVDTVVISAGSLGVDGDLTATSGVTVSGSGTLRIGPGGSVSGDVINSGTLNPLGTIVGNLTLTGASVLQIRAADGTTVNGFVELGGVLELDLTGIDFLLDRVVFDIITARGVQGSFSPYEVAGLADGLSFTADIIQRRGLSIYQGVVERNRQEVPEPATWVLLATALAALLSMRKRLALRAGFNTP